MPISKQDVEHVAQLARLGLSEAEKELFTQQLSAILEFADSLKKWDTEDLPPTSHVIPVKNIMREDVIIPCENVENILANAPDEEKHMFRVPKIIE